MPPDRPALATAARVRYVTVPIEQLVARGGGECGSGGGQCVLARDQHDPNGPLVERRIIRTYQRTAYHLRVVSIRDGDGREQTVRVTDEHPFFVAGRGWTKARDLSAGDRLAGAAGEASTVTSNLGEDHPEGVTVYNLEVEDDHTYFVRAEGSDGEPVWVHNANYEKADPATRQQGERFSALAEGWWDLLPEGKAYKATIAVSEAKGRPVVSLYANIGEHPTQFSAADVTRFLRSVEEAGGIGIHTFGNVHAEVALHRMYPQVSAIGISNPNGPCSARCGVYFERNRYFNIYWPDRP